MRKEMKSVLDPYAAKLAEMAAAKKTLREMKEWLKGEGGYKKRISLGTIGSYLKRQRAVMALEKQSEAVLDRIAGGSKTCRELEKEFEKNPPPSMELLMKLQRKLVMTVSTAANGDPTLVKLVTAAFEPVMENESLRIKRGELSLNRRKVAVMEQKAEAAGAAAGAGTEPTLSPEEQRERLKEILK